MSNGARYYVSDRTRSLVFNGLCDAERSVRCFQDEHRLHTKSFWGWLAGAPYFAPLLMTAYQNAWNILGQGVQIFLSLIPLSGVLVIRRRDGYKGAVAHFVQEECGKVASEMKQLLEDVDENVLSDQEARERLSALSGKLGVATNKARIAKITISETKRRKVQQEVVNELGGIYR